MLATATGVSRAESKLLTAEVAGLQTPVRSGAPITVVWKLRSQSTSLLEGRLELKVKDGHERLARIVTDEIVLTSGEQMHRVVLPTLDTTHLINTVEMELRFVGTKQTIDLGTHSSLRIPSPWQRTHVLAISDPWQRTLTADKRAFVEHFRFESYNADPEDKTITTNTAHIPPEMMSADPLGYFGFDIVLLMNEGFADLKEAQLQALAGWVEAGGSLAVAPGRQVMRSEHLKFLNDLAKSSPESELLLDSTGRLSPPANDAPAAAPAASPRILLKRYGLGRVAVVRDPVDGLGPTALSELRRMIAFLWKLRHDRLDRFVAKRLWDARPKRLAAPVAQADNPNLPPGIEVEAKAVDPDLLPGSAPDDEAETQSVDPNLPVDVANAMISQIRPRDMQLAPLALQTGDQLLARLMPRNLRVIPLSLIACMLAVYVLVIGPADYLILGAIKRRRYTWILFPAVTIGFAIGTVSLSNWYMRVADNRRSVTFLDVGEGTKIARRNRFDLLFRGAQGESVTDMQRGYFAAMNHQQFTRGSWYNYQMAVRQGTENQLELVAIPEYQGRVPARYAVLQYLPQWTPQLNRLCSLAEDETEFDWRSLASLNVTEPNSLMSDAARRQIVDAVKPAFGNDASIYVITGGALRYIDGQTGVLQQNDPQHYSQEAYAYQQPYYAGQQPVQSTFLLDVCLGTPHGGLFNVLSQISPHGGNNFEDMALVDSSDPRQWLLIVMIDRGDELLVYRKLYTGE
jgi:hypothetical protein